MDDFIVLSAKRDISSHTEFLLNSLARLGWSVNLEKSLLEPTVLSRYLGSKKPLGGFYHYINLGSFFLMLLDKYGIKLYIRDVFFYQSVWCRG